MKKNKVIFIHKIPYPYGPHFNRDKNIKDFFHYGLGRLIIDNINKLKINHKLTFENWRIDPGIEYEEQRHVDGVKCRLFPGKKYNRIGALSFFFLHELRKECNHNNVILHFTNSPHMFILQLTCIYLNKCPIVASHLGGSDPYFRYKFENRKISYLRYILERFTLKNVDKFFVSVKGEKNYLEKFVNKKKVHYGPIQGVEDYFINHPEIKKSQAREKLNLPKDKKIILSIGRLYNYKGAQENIRVFKQLKKEFDVMWVAIGTDKDNPYYNEAKEAGANLYPYISRENGLKYFFYAADLYSCPLYNDLKTKEYGGTGIATLEALFCNTPVVGNVLKHLPNNEAEKVGIIPDNFEEFYRAIKEIFNQPNLFGNTRKIVMKYYTWKKVLEKYINTYDTLFMKYYNQNIT